MRILRALLPSLGNIVYICMYTTYKKWNVLSTVPTLALFCCAIGSYLYMICNVPNIFPRHVLYQSLMYCDVVIVIRLIHCGTVTYLKSPKNGGDKRRLGLPLEELVRLGCLVTENLNTPHVPCFKDETDRLYFIKSHQIRSDQIRYSPIRSDQIRYSPIGSDQIRSHRLKAMPHQKVQYTHKINSRWRQKRSLTPNLGFHTSLPSKHQLVWQ